MFENIEMMNMARAVTAHAAQRGKVVARNIANSDTPEYRARDLEPFSQVYKGTASHALRVSHPRHMPGSAFDAGTAREIHAGEVAAPNGNSVSLEEELLKTAQVKRAHDLSLGVYSAGLQLMRSSLGKR